MAKNQILRIFLVNYGLKMIKRTIYLATIICQKPSFSDTTSSIIIQLTVTKNDEDQHDALCEFPKEIINIIQE